MPKECEICLTSGGAPLRCRSCTVTFCAQCFLTQLRTTKVPQCLKCGDNWTYSMLIEAGASTSVVEEVKNMFPAHSTLYPNCRNHFAGKRYDLVLECCGEAYNGASCAKCGCYLCVVCLRKSQDPRAGACCSHSAEDFVKVNEHRVKNCPGCMAYYTLDDYGCSDVVCPLCRTSFNANTGLISKRPNQHALQLTFDFPAIRFLFCKTKRGDLLSELLKLHYLIWYAAPRPSSFDEWSILMDIKRIMSCELKTFFRILDNCHAILDRIQRTPIINASEELHRTCLMDQQKRGIITSEATSCASKVAECLEIYALELSNFSSYSRCMARIFLNFSKWININAQNLFATELSSSYDMGVCWLLHTMKRKNTAAAPEPFSCELCGFSSRMYDEIQYSLANSMDRYFKVFTHTEDVFEAVWDSDVDDNSIEDNHRENFVMHMF